MPRRGARVIGMDRLKRKVESLELEYLAVVRREILTSALNVQAGAKRRAPVDTGRLRNSITFEVSSDGSVVRVGTNLDYAPFVEFGTRRMRAKPYLFPAFEHEYPRFRDRLKRGLERASSKVGRVR